MEVRMARTGRPKAVLVLTEEERDTPATSSALGYLEELFGRRGRPGILMAARALRLALPEERVQALSVAYTGALLQTVADA